MAANPFLAFFNNPAWRAQSSQNSALGAAQKNVGAIDPGFNQPSTVPSPRPPTTVGVAPQKPSVTTPAVSGGDRPMYAGGTPKWKYDESIGGPNPAVGNPSQPKSVGVPKPPMSAQQQQYQQLQRWNPQGQQGWGGDQRPTPIQAMQQPQYNPNQMFFQSGYQQSPYGGQQTPPWMQYQQQPQWGGQANYYNQMNPWAQMPGYQMQQPQMGYGQAFNQFAGGWQSPFANRPQPNYRGPANMPVVPNLPTQQPQYVQTPWG